MICTSQKTCRAIFHIAQHISLDYFHGSDDAQEGLHNKSVTFHYVYTLFSFTMRLGFYVLSYLLQINYFSHLRALFLCARNKYSTVHCTYEVTNTSVSINGKFAFSICVCPFFACSSTNAPTRQRISRTVDLLKLYTTYTRNSGSLYSLPLSSLSSTLFLFFLCLCFLCRSGL